MSVRHALATVSLTVAIGGFGLLPGVACALDYRAVVDTAILYDAPSQKAKPLFIIAAGTPVEAVIALDAWVKVRDSKGELAWIERRQLTERRTLQVRGDGPADIRSEPRDDAPLVFVAEPDVLLDWLGPASAGWLPVGHRDGQKGYVRLARVWGH